MTLPSNFNRFGRSMRRPYYCEVEYLESSGTQWIDTGVPARENTRVLARLYTDETGNKNWFGAGVSQVNGGAFVFSSHSTTEVEYLWGFHTGTWIKPATSDAVGKKFDIDFSKNGVIINGTTLDVTTDTWGNDSDLTITLFVRNGGSAYISGRIYYLQIYNDGVLIRDFIPVLDWNMRPALYDRITNTLFYNSGSGEFTTGRQIHYVDYLESTGTQYKTNTIKHCLNSLPLSGKLQLFSLPAFLSSTPCATIRYSFVNSSILYAVPKMYAIFLPVESADRSPNSQDSFSLT